MLRNSTQHVCLKGLAAIILAGCQADAEQLVLVIDLAEVTPAVLAEAREHVALIFRKAGIRLRLLDCSATAEMPNCDDLANKRPLYVQVLPTRPVKPMNKAALGCAHTTSEGGTYAFIFYPQLDDLIATVWPPASRAQVLRHAMAHEIGHLLGGPEHGPSGLMRGTWDDPDYLQMARTGMLIAAPDAARMRENLERRAASAPTGSIIEYSPTNRVPSTGNSDPAIGVQPDRP